MEKSDGPLRTAASFGHSTPDTSIALDHASPLTPGSRFATSILDRGVAEIINNYGSDPRASDSERELNAVICAPLRAGQRKVGVIALANTGASASYSAANL